MLGFIACLMDIDPENSDSSYLKRMQIFTRLVYLHQVDLENKCKLIFLNWFTTQIEQTGFTERKNCNLTAMADRHKRAETIYFFGVYYLLEMLLISSIVLLIDSMRFSLYYIHVRKNTITLKFL